MEPQFALIRMEQILNRRCGMPLKPQPDVLRQRGRGNPAPEPGVRKLKTNGFEFPQRFRVQRSPLFPELGIVLPGFEEMRKLIDMQDPGTAAKQMPQ